MQHTVLITGANRGIGLEFAKQYAEERWQVYACCRNPQNADALNKLQEKFNNIVICKLDVNDAEQINFLAKQLANAKIDLLINNAGIYGQTGVRLGNVAVDNLQAVMMTNAFAPLKIVEAFAEQVARSEFKQIVQLSSEMGSLNDSANHGGAYAYRASKAAVNMLMKTLAVDLANRGIKILILSPGWVKTEMGGSEAPVKAAESVAAMRNVISKHRNETGVFYGFDDQKINW